MIRRRLDALGSRISAWTKTHNLLTHVIVTTLIVAPGYARIEGLVQDIIDARTSSRIVSCEDSNDLARKHNTAFALVFEPQAGSEARTPKEKAEAARLLKILLVPLRDCSPDAVSQHYKEPTK